MATRDELRARAAAAVGEWFTAVDYGVIEVSDTLGYNYYGAIAGLGRLLGVPTAYEWSKDEYDRLHPAVQAVRALLEDWFHAMENGTATQRMPDYKYVPAIDMVTCDAIIARIESEFAHELQAWAHLEVAGLYDAGPGFNRLAGPQRLALCQAIHRIKRKHFPQETVD